MRLRATMPKSAALAALPLLLSAAGVAAQDGFRTYQALCAKNGRVIEYKPVTPAAGFYWKGNIDGGKRGSLGCRAECFSALFIHGYKFVESEDPPTPAEREMIDLDGVVGEFHSHTWAPGYYRYTLARRGDRRCALFERHTEPRLEYQWPPVRAARYDKRFQWIADKVAAHCIAAEKIARPTAKYAWETEIDARSFTGSFILSRRWTLTERSTGDLVVEFNQHMFGKGRRRVFCPEAPKNFSIKNVLR